MKVAEFLLGSLPLLIQLYADLYRKTDLENTMLQLESEFNVPKIKTYDFIIVGGESAGCIVAARLSEFFNVLLLEAGGTPPPATEVPYYAIGVTENPSINNFFQTIPQAINNQIIRSPTGNMLGGSGSHNGMMHNRGSPKDYDNWATLLNDDSFNYSNVLKYFNRMETHNGPKVGDVSDEYYGKDGPIQVHSLFFPMMDVWFDAARELGYRIQDPNAYQREGFSAVNMAIFNGRRSSSYNEYIKPYEGLRKSLTIVRYANVSEILLYDDKKAYGIAYMRHGFPQIAHAHKEIIISAGTFSTPLLLMKSGIGPESVLNAAGIPVKVASEAVGKNLKDHTGGGGVNDFLVNDTSLFLTMNSEDIERITAEYHRGEGPLTIRGSAGWNSVQGFFVSSRAPPDWPDNWLYIRTSVSIDGAEPSISFGNVLARPKSKGFLTLDTEKYKAGVRDDVQLALIDYNQLSHPDDIEVILEGIKLLFRIVETEAFKRVNFTYNGTPLAACNAFTYLSDDYWRCVIRQGARGASHPMGTCSLGPDSTNSTTSVVDTKFRVKGVSNLRIVDASVMPEITNGNINAPVMMLAEKAADDIINFYEVTETTNSVPPQTNPVSTSPNSLNTTPSKSTSILVDTNRWLLVSIFMFVDPCYVTSIEPTDGASSNSIIDLNDASSRIKKFHLRCINCAF